MEGQYVMKVNKERNVLYYYEQDNRKLDYISPIMTTQYDFKQNRGTIPKWEEILVFNEQFNHFTDKRPNVLILFELLDKLKRNDKNKIESTFIDQGYTSQDTGGQWRRIAWAFLKVFNI
jgi:jouberin